MLKVLVATKQTQGQRKNDFCHVPEEELVRFGFACDRDADDPNGSCGCNRSLIGFDCQKATTTFRIMSIAMTKERYIAEYLLSLGKVWDTLGSNLIADLIDDTNRLLKVADYHREGAVLEYRAGEFALRK
jgi:hypothetical protein